MTHTTMNTLRAGRIALLGLICAWSGSALAASTYTPVADAYIQAEPKADVNYGTATTLNVRTNGAAPLNYDSYLRFDLTPETSVVATAKLRLYAALSVAGSAGGSVATTAYAVSNTTWAETGITWNNKPVLGSALGSATVNQTTYAWYEIDVSVYVRSELAAGRKVVSFAYHDAANSIPYIEADSREATNKPQLVVTPDVAPTVSLTAPANGTVYIAPGTITLSASAADSDGTVAKVDFYNGTTLLGTATAAPYNLTWNNVPAGSYSLTAVATDDLGAATASVPVTVIVDMPPNIVLTAPANGSVYIAPAAIALTANAADSDGTVARVDFYNGTTLLGTATAAPYTYTWNGVAAGTYSVSATATDNRGASTTSVAATVAVNAQPTVTLTAPANGTTYTAPASITLTANAVDSDGSIARVDFYNGATLIGSTTAAPYTFAWSNVAAGTYTLTAQATDNLGASITSAGITVTVNEAVVAPGLYYIHADQLNTPRAITDSSNKVIWRWDSDPFGTMPADEDPDKDGVKMGYNLRFPGQYYDKETGLHYNYYRDYDPGTGRYVESDPIGIKGGINTYTYVEGNPVSRIDPDGLLFMTTFGGLQRGTTLNQAVEQGTPGTVAGGLGIGIIGTGAAIGVIGPAGVRTGAMCYRAVENNKDICNNAAMAAILGASICGNMSGTVKGSARSYPRDRERIEDVGNAGTRVPRRNTGTDPR